MMRVSIVLCVFSLALPASSPGRASGGRYLTWVDDNGGVHNTSVDGQFDRQQRQARQRIGQSDRARVLNKADNATQWPGNSSGGGSKRHYYIWIDANGNVQNSFCTGAQVAGQRADYVLPSGEHSAEYIDAEAFGDKGFVRSENGSPYYTWVDERGRMHDSQVPPGERAAHFKREAAPPSQIVFAEGRQIEFKRRLTALPGLDGAGQQSDTLKALLEDTEMTIDDFCQDLQRHCCEQIAESDFTELDADESRYEELNRFSPSFDFPMGRSFYVAIRLPRSQGVYGLRIRSFTNRQVVYPSLLFLDEHKRPTWLVSDAAHKLNPETWYRCAFIEGTVPVRANRGERYVLLLTTDENRSLQTLDNEPFKRPLQDLAVNEAGMQVHEHTRQGGFELAVVR